MKKITRFTPVKGAPKAPIKSASRDRMYGGKCKCRCRCNSGWTQLHWGGIFPIFRPSTLSHTRRI